MGAGKENLSCDAVVLLSAGIRRSPHRLAHPELYDPIDTYLPTDFRHGDDFGISGGGMRIAAAEKLVRDGATHIVGFIGGASEKMKARWGNDVPSDGVVYQRSFLRLLERRRQRDVSLLLPATLVADQSVNTAENFGEASDMIQREGWETVLFLTSDYHVPRGTVLFERNKPRGVQVKIIGAETYLKEVIPGRYDDIINEAYQSPLGLERIRNEAQGVNDLASGKYHYGEFQFAK